jgi:hypothetical protein
VALARASTASHLFPISASQNATNAPTRARAQNDPRSQSTYHVRVLLALTARQCGQTTTTTWAMAHAALFFLGSLRLVACPAQRQSAEAVRRVREAVIKADSELETYNVYGLDLMNGSRLLALPHRRPRREFENRLRDIETDRANLAMDGSLSGSFRRNHPMATLLPQRGRRPQHQSRPCGPAYMPLNFRSSPKADIVSRHWLLTFAPITELRQPIATTSRFCYTSRLASLCSLHSAWGPHASGASSIFATSRGCCWPPGRSANCESANLSCAAGEADHRIPRGRRGRHCCEDFRPLVG